MNKAWRPLSLKKASLTKTIYSITTVNPNSSLTSRIIACSSVSPFSTCPPGRDLHHLLFLTLQPFPCSRITPFATSTLIFLGPKDYIELDYYSLTVDKLNVPTSAIRNAPILLACIEVVRSRVQLDFVY